MSGSFYINPDNFKKWMNSQEEFNHSMECKLVGLQVETRFGAKRIMKKMTIESGRACKVAKDFAENGGVISEVIGEEYLIKVGSGSFLISKNMVIF
jgi:antitoxin component YwqK of YwqJK toxin-antitoxin module